MKKLIVRSTIDWGEGDLELAECLDCGAHAVNNKRITHAESCEAGNAKKWEKYYEQEQENE